MQRLFTYALVVIAILYGSAHAFTTYPHEYFTNEPEPVIPTVRHIALLLPLKSPSFGQAAEVVREGFVAATMRERQLPLPIRIYSTTDDPLDILIAYHQALDAGAVLIVGPLTRDGVSALASSGVIDVPIITLNAADNETGFPPNLYLFGLQMENEASQIAEFAMTENKRHAIIINDGGSLSIRLQTAFTQRWLAEYGHTAESLQYVENPDILAQFREYTEGENNVIFLALDAAKSRFVRSYLSPDTPVFATSQIFIDNDDSLFNHDLNGIRFMDMPWIIQLDHPAVMAYRHTVKARSTDMERLYALGIDAFRLMALTLQVQAPHEISFDGVTGHVRFIHPNHFIREPIAAKFENGRVLLQKPRKERKY
ncbi:MAG: penicillin-binding protein activator [Nitrosomonas sp.]|nr:penicillin-binding protein activator [Nitrosomonas sp.]